jgi:hypothetical protein
MKKRPQTFKLICSVLPPRFGVTLFYSTPPVKVEQLPVIAWPRREKIKTQVEKIKTQWEKNIIYFPPVEIRRYCHKKDCVPQEK